MRLHPLVCAAFNADFDGDQMAVHVPLSFEAQIEARLLMLASNNVLKLADGEPVIMDNPQDILLGCYYLTKVKFSEGDKEPRRFSSPIEARSAYESQRITLHQPIVVRIDDEGVDTTVGRLIFNEVMPPEIGFINRSVAKDDIKTITAEVHRHLGNRRTAEFVDTLKKLGYHYATMAGVSIAIDDVVVPTEKDELIDEAMSEVDKVRDQYANGIITDGERRQKEVEIWNSATSEVTARMVEALEADWFNPIDMMVKSGARGNMMQVRQIAGMRGLVANPRGDMIPRPIKSNFREGLAMLEYFIATPGARKGLVDTALRTADSGYLTRRLVDVSQELIVNDTDPFEAEGAVRGIWIDGVQADV